MRIAVGRPVNGISINGLEYLLDGDGEVIVFPSIASAHAFLESHGIDDEVVYVKWGDEKDGN